LINKNKNKKEMSKTNTSRSPQLVLLAVLVAQARQGKKEVSSEEALNNHYDKIIDEALSIIDKVEGVLTNTEGKEVAS
jgi:hypothetical protein